MKTPYIINKFNIGQINGLLDKIEIVGKIKVQRLSNDNQLKNMFEDISKKMKVRLNINVSKNDIYNLNKNFEKIFAEVI
jgi:hypothetical protein